MSCVLPGVAEVLAIDFRLHSILIKEDLPTFERPINAYSGISGFGHFSKLVLLTTNSASLIIIEQSNEAAKVRCSVGFGE